MSTLKIDNLSDRLGVKTVPIADVLNGPARAWVNFNGTGAVAIRAAYNVASITDNGVGDYTVNFTTALASADYCYMGTAGLRVGNTMSIEGHPTVAPTASALRIISTVYNYVPTDTVQINVGVLR